MTSYPRFHIDASGRWSGGGSGVVANLRLAAERADVLTADARPGTTALIPRNVPTRLREFRRPFVWMPQNALPWGPASPRERSLQSQLRVATQLTSMRAQAMVRISGAIPPLRGRRPTSEVLHNVLDEGFEAALPGQVKEAGAFVCVGSAHGYRRLVELVDGYAKYREAGGRTELILQITPGTLSIERELDAAAARVPGLAIRKGCASRTQVLALMASSAGVLLPSDVEASPMTLLEAQALGRSLACSRIRAHDEQLELEDVPRFWSAQPESVANALRNLDEQGRSRSHQLQDPSARAAARTIWVNRLSKFLDALE